MERTRGVWAVAMVAAAFLIVGCGPDKTVEVRYERPAQYDISPKVKRLGIAEFGAQTAQEKSWGEVASDRLAADLEQYNRKYHRYQLVDRRRLKAILDEQDLQLAICDTASANQLGTLAGVEAMIYGNVKVSTRDESASRKTFDPLRRGFKTVYYTRRYAMVAVNFTMDDIKTGKTLATVSATREYDSDADKKSGSESVGKALGFGGDKVPPTDQVVSKLIDQCVAEFLGKISPHEVVVVEKLAKGKGKTKKTVDTGNKLAVAGDYAEALDVYLTALDVNGADHGAAFNAGLMCEAQGNLQKAEEMYDKAFRMDPKEQYVLARKRVRIEGGQ